MDDLTPEWFNTEYLSECLRNESKNNNLTVTDFAAEPAVPPGNNYGSVVIRVKISYKDKTSKTAEESSRSLIVKLPLTKGAIKDIFGDTIDKEYIFYHDYLPKAYVALKNEFAPKFYPSPRSVQVVVLEDLKIEGYMMADRRQQLNLAECEIYMKTAASFHAGSVAVYQQHPELVISLGSEIMFSDGIKTASSNKNMIRYGLECMADCILKTIGDERISNIVRRCSTSLWDSLIEALKPNGTLNTLNQGDPWLTNMMFKYDSKGNPVALKILDFQALRYSSPASDLVFFIWSSAKHSVREDHLEQLVKTYFEALSHRLEEAKSGEVWSIDLLNKDIQKMSPLVLWICGLCLPLMSNKEASDAEGIWAQCEKEYTPEKNPYKQYYTDDFCTNEVTRVVKQLETHKVFEYLERCLSK